MSSGHRTDTGRVWIGEARSWRARATPDSRSASIIGRGDRLRRCGGFSIPARSAKDFARYRRAGSRYRAFFLCAGTNFSRDRIASMRRCSSDWKRFSRSPRQPDCARSRRFAERSRAKTSCRHGRRDLDDLYTGPLLEAQLVIARAIAERLPRHPALLAWDIGHAFTDVRPPRSGTRSTGDHGSAPVAEREVAAWSKRIAAELKPAGIATTAGTTAIDITTETYLRLGSMCAPFAFASMQGSSCARRVRAQSLRPRGAAVSCRGHRGVFVQAGAGHRVRQPDVPGRKIRAVRAVRTARRTAALEHLAG